MSKFFTLSGNQQREYKEIRAKIKMLFCSIRYATFRPCNGEKRHRAVLARPSTGEIDLSYTDGSNTRIVHIHDSFP